MNIRLFLGILLLIPVCAAALFGPILAPYDKHYSESVRYEETEGGRVLVAPPSPPSREYLLGTDQGGKDLLSLILYGARWTVATTLILAALKVLLGAFFGIRGVFNKRRKKGFSPLNALPQILFLYFVLAGISQNFPFSEMILIVFFGIIVLFFGLPAISSSLEAEGRDLAAHEFFIAAKASGAGSRYLVIHHLLPFLKERFLTLFIGEMISVLNTMGQMGIFGIFLGATVLTFDPPIQRSRLHEWAGLVGQARFSVYSDQWILLAPLFAYIQFLLALYLIHEGLTFRFRKTYRI